MSELHKNEWTCSRRRLSDTLNVSVFDVKYVKTEGSSFSYCVSDMSHFQTFFLTYLLGTDWSGTGVKVRVLRVSGKTHLTF